tara:strand:+ start:86 stop:223 length:138 start_codon:yes stop_codon:yes gene_type:complete
MIAWDVIITLFVGGFLFSSGYHLAYKQSLYKERKRKKQLNESGKQ